jgi:NADPH:quinone reductase-like Zn-dependent oxidoreductase
VRDVDVVLDTVGGDMPQRSYGVLKEGGRLVTSAPMLSPEVQAEAESQGIRASMVMAQSNGEQFAQLAEQIDTGKVKVFVYSAYPLEEAQAALDRVKSGHPTGKVVLSIG